MTDSPHIFHLPMEFCDECCSPGCREPGRTTQVSRVLMGDCRLCSLVFCHDHRRADPGMFSNDSSRFRVSELQENRARWLFLEKNTQLHRLPRHQLRACCCPRRREAPRCGNGDAGSIPPAMFNRDCKGHDSASKPMTTKHFPKNSHKSVLIK
jgi:hypothetical protein